MEFLKRLELKLSMTAFGTWIIKTFSSHIDPAIFRLSGGRLTSLGPVVIPHLLLTTTGRKSGRQRDAQLVYTDIDGVIHIEASNFGDERHPAWFYNLEADSNSTIQLRGKTLAVTAERLSEQEKESVWERLVENIPNYALYKERTGRDIKIFRLLPRTT